MESTAALTKQEEVTLPNNMAEKLDMLIEAVNALHDDLRDLRARFDQIDGGVDVDDGRDPAMLFEKAWKNAQSGGKTYPVEELWDRVYAE